MQLINVGDTVELKPMSHAGMHHVCPEGRTNNVSATVRAFMGEDCPGGLVMDQDLRGCLYWNINDVQKVVK